MSTQLYIKFCVDVSSYSNKFVEGLDAFQLQCTTFNVLPHKGRGKVYVPMMSLWTILGNDVDVIFNVMTKTMLLMYF